MHARSLTALGLASVLSGPLAADDLAPQWSFDMAGPFGVAMYADTASGALLAEVFCEPGREAEIALHDFAPDSGAAAAPTEDDAAQLTLSSPAGEVRYFLDLSRAEAGAASFAAIVQDQRPLWRVFDTDARVLVSAGGYAGALIIGDARADFQRLAAYCAG